MPISRNDFKLWQSLPRDAWVTESEDVACLYRKVRSIICGLLVPRYEAVVHDWNVLTTGIELVLDAVHSRVFSEDELIEANIRAFVGVAGLPGFEMQVAPTASAALRATPQLRSYNAQRILRGLCNLSDRNSPFAAKVWKRLGTLSPQDIFGLEGLDLPHEEDRGFHHEFEALLERCRDQLRQVLSKNVDALVRRFLLDEMPQQIADSELGNRSALLPAGRKEHDKLRARISSAATYCRKNRPLTDEALQAVVPALKL